jgi:hypothetical protein
MDASLSRHCGALRERSDLIASVRAAAQRPSNIYTASAHEPVQRWFGKAQAQKKHM